MTTLLQQLRALKLQKKLICHIIYWMELPVPICNIWDFLTKSCWKISFLLEHFRDVNLTLLEHFRAPKMTTLLEQFRALKPPLLEYFRALQTTLLKRLCTLNLTNLLEHFKALNCSIFVCFIALNTVSLLVIFLMCLFCKFTK